MRTPEQARAAGPVDYLIAGTVFPTLSKSPEAPLIGVDGLAAIVRVSQAPVLAIGGVTVDRLPAITSAGAAGIAAIGLFASPASMTRAVEAVRAPFDSVKTAP